MSRIIKYSDFILEKKLVERYLIFVATGDFFLNEGESFLDRVKNSLSKSILGSLSYIKMIDNLVDKVEELERELIEKQYKFEDEIDDLDSKIDQARDKLDTNRIKDLQAQRKRKAEEIRSYLDSQKLKIKKGISLINQTVGNNLRRKEYSKTKMDDKNLSVAEYRYEVAKKRSSGQEELSSLEKKIKDSRERAKKSSDVFKEKIESENSKKSIVKRDSKTGRFVSGKVKDIDPAREKKIISSRKAVDLIERRERVEIEIAKTKSLIERELGSLYNKISNSPLSKQELESSKIYLLELSNNLDSYKNLLSLYRSIGSTEDKISKVLSKESSFTEIANKINSSISDGKDAGSGTTQMISDLFKSLESSQSSDKIKKVENKIKN